jgi:hypothetical protein
MLQSRQLIPAARAGKALLLPQKNRVPSVSGFVAGYSAILSHNLPYAKQRSYIFPFYYLL